MAVHAGASLLAPLGASAQQPQAQSDAQRIDVLEERIRDLQAVIGTLQTFVRDGGAAALPDAAANAAPGGGAPNDLAIRVLALETQIKALTAQMSEAPDRAGPSGGTPGVPGNPWQQGENTAPPPPNPWQQGENAAPPAPPGPAGAQLGGDPRPTPGFDSVTQSPQQAAQMPALPPPGSGAAGARGMYDASYQSFVRNDLAGAEQGFQNFVSSFPDDPLSTNAYYWLGRTHFDREQYEPAAKAFLAGYKRDKKSAIAPDSLLHLGLSLARLGEKDAACSTLAAVPRQYPEAPDQLRQSATDAMKQAGC